MTGATPTFSTSLYEGWVRHRRRTPVAHAFRYPLFMTLLDLDEIPEIFDRFALWSSRRPALLRFRREDYHGPAEISLDRAVRDTVEREASSRPDGRIRLLTHLRNLGHVFNPVSLYYCDDASGNLHSIVAEITNTPWKQRHAYVLSDPVESEGRRRSFRLRKTFHVSPFQPMDLSYDWTFTVPGRHLVVQMESREEEGSSSFFDATLVLRRRPVTGSALARMALVHAGMTIRTVAWIHWQALRLWLRRVPFHPHPDPGVRRSWP